MKKQLNISIIDEMLKNSLVCTNFVDSRGFYVPVEGMEMLRKVVDMKLMEYNESNAMMDLGMYE